MKKRLLSIIASLIFVLNFITTGAANAFQFYAAFTSVQQISEVEGLSVTYSASDSWLNYRNVTITLKNNSTEIIQNWSLAFSVAGEIENLWNAEIYKRDDEKYLIKNVLYNKDIPVGGEVQFGYTLKDCDNRTPNFIYASKRADKLSGYEVDFSIDQQWDNGFNANIEIRNTTDTKIYSWELEINKNFIVNSIWNVDVLDNYEGFIKTTGDYPHTDLAPNSSILIGLTAEGHASSAEISNVLLSEIIFDEYIFSELPDLYPNITDSSSIISASASVEQPNTINFHWYSSVKEGKFDIWESEDGINFIKIGTVTDATQYSYNIAEDFETKDYKVTQTFTNNETIESPMFTVQAKNGYIFVNESDSDSDNIPDFLEEILHLDSNSNDTDNDNISDYDEIHLTFTDPAVYDSVTSGLTDGNVDRDYDLLCSVEELNLYTDPNDDDTDQDGLCDGEEVKTYDTNPLNPDTDEDGISDYDELMLGLDPNSEFTNGIKDSEKIFSKSVSEENEILYEVNPALSPVKVSAEISAAGNILNSLEASESSYTSAIYNDAMLGVIPEFTYPDNLKIESFEVKFKIDEDYVAFDTDGLQRYTIFRFYDDQYSLLPIETKYDEENNVVSAKTDMLGSYAVIDLNQLMDDWKFKLEEIGYGYQEEQDNTADSETTIELNEEIQNLQLPSTASILSNNTVSSTESLTKNTVNISSIDEAVYDGVNIIFMIDGRESISKEDLSLINKQAVDTMRIANGNTNNLNVYTVIYGLLGNDYTVLQDGKPLQYSDSVYRIWNATSREIAEGELDVTGPLEFVAKIAEESIYPTYAFSIFNENNLYFRYPSGTDLLEKCKAANVKISNIAPITLPKIGFMLDAQDATNGIHINSYEFQESVIKFIFGEDYVYVPSNNEIVEKRTYIIPNNLEIIELDEPITPLSKEAYDAIERDINNVAEYIGASDYDDDGLYDFLEADLSDYRFNNGDIKIVDNEIILKTASEYFCKNPNVSSDTKSKMAELSVQVLPVKTPIMSEDLDCDNITDYNDPNPFYYDEVNLPGKMLYISNADNSSYLTYGETTANFGFSEFSYVESQNQQYYFTSSYKGGYNISISDLYGEPLLTATEENGVARIKIADYFNNPEQRWDIYQNDDGMYVISPCSIYYAGLSLNQRGQLANGNTVNLTSVKTWDIPTEFNGTKITLNNYDEFSGEGSPEEFFYNNIWPIMRYQNPDLDDVDSGGAFIEWAHSVYYEIDGGYLYVYNLFDAYFVDASEEVLAYWIWGMGESIVDTAQGTWDVLSHPIKSMNDIKDLLTSMLNEEDRKALMDACYYEIERIYSTYTEGEAYAKAQMFGKHTLSIIETIATVSAIDCAQIIDTIKSFPKIISNLAVSVKDAGLAATMLKQISNLAVSARNTVCTMLNNIADSARYAASLTQEGLDRLSDIIYQLENNIDFANAMNRLVFAGDGFGEYAYRGFDLFMDAGDQFEDVTDILIENPRVADVIDNMPENTQQEIADILIGNADSDTIADDLVDKFDESGKIGVDEVICENGTCFTADTLISTQYGMKRIDEIKPGDKVYSFDEKTKEISLKSVLQVYEKESSELVHITVGDSVINATPTHPFYVPIKGWIAACDLQAGDVLYTVNGEYVVVEQVQHEILETPIKVYNFSVADNHTYFVSDFNVCVHNKCLTDNMISLLKEDGWSDDIIEAIRKNGSRSEEVAETLRRCNLTETTINGRKTLIQEIDLTICDEDGLTNLQRMKTGKAPLDENGKAIELHHIDQTMDSPYAELPWDEHRGKGQHGTMHDLTKKSEIDRPVFGEQKKQYWIERAQIIEENML